MQAPKWTTAIEIVDPLIKSVSALQEYGVQVKTTLHEWVLAGGEQRRRIADLLHGVPIGHPLHAILTDIPIGAWTFSALFDLLSLINPFSKHYKQTADDLTALGIVSAIPTALAGITDYSSIKEEASDYGLLHGIMNTAGLLLYILSWRARRRHQRLLGIGYGMLGMSVITASAWLGGEMVYRLRVGSNHSPKPEAPEEWTAVFPAKELEESEVQKVELDGQPILLYRRNGNVSAISAICAHAGGPLDEGKFFDGCVQCPWHDSVFDLSSGQIVHGPTVYPQPTYDVRITNGQIRLRAPQQDAPKS